MTLRASANLLIILFLTFFAGQARATDPPQDQQPQDAQAAQEADKEKEKDKDAETDKLQVYDEIQVTSRASDMLGVADSASEGVTGHVDLAKRPILRPGELLETVPGVIITQHSGGGKANQYFLRGFNLDHGTDFRITVDGMPVNMPTHGHGQGYSDLNFMIPELVDSIRYKKGAYYADEGDFSAAGAASISFLETLDKGLLLAAPGNFGYQRFVAADAVKAAGGNLLGAVEYNTNNGPWERPDDYRKLNGILRWSRGDASRGLTVTAMGYDGTWDSTDQIPERAVAEGLVGRFGGLDPTDGGASKRYSLSAELRRGDDRSLTRVTAYAIRYDLDLFSNFTYFLDDPVNGDQFEQTDRRTVTGFRAERQWEGALGGHTTETTVGFETRGDDIRNGLFHTQDRQRLDTTREDHVLLWTAAPYLQARTRWSSWLRTVAGLRADGWWTDVSSDRAENSGRRSAAILSPKLSFLLGPWDKTEVYLNFGEGFHSNDARGATIRVDPKTGEPAQRVDPLVRAKSADFGVRTSILPDLQTAVTVFGLDLASELLFVGDAGITEASRPSRRTGIEWQNFYRPRPWLSLDADLAWSNARFRDRGERAPEGDHIPGAIQRAAAAGASLDFGKTFGSLRLRYFGPRPLLEDDSVRSASSTLVNAELGYRFPAGLVLALEVFNLFDEKASDIDYFYESQLRGEAEPVADIHFHPAEKRSARLSAQWRF